MGSNHIYKPHVFEERIKSSYTEQSLTLLNWVKTINTICPFLYDELKWDNDLNVLHSKFHRICGITINYILTETELSMDIY